MMNQPNNYVVNSGKKFLGLMAEYVLYAPDWLHETFEFWGMWEFAEHEHATRLQKS